MVTEAEARRLRPFMSGMVALAVTLAATLVWYFMGRPDETPVPVRTVDWSAWVKAGRSDASLLLFAPDALPAGWRATTVRFYGGDDPHWHLGMLTGAGKYVGVEESRDPVKDLVAEFVDKDASQGADVTVGGETWQTWTDEGGDYALVRQIEVNADRNDTIMVVGSAPDADIRSFAESLKTVPKP